jgi:hypothetical protein
MVRNSETLSLLAKIWISPAMRAVSATGDCVNGACARSPRCKPWELGTRAGGRGVVLVS